MKEMTIAAIATPPGAGGIGIVRLSGTLALSIADQMVRPAGKKRVAELRGYTGLYGRVYDLQGEIDDAVVFVYRAPKSYTGEDIAEICCHGGTYLLQRVLHRCLELGAKTAPAGAYTKRAFLAGKLSLTQAEAVAALIGATGRQSAAMALAARDGSIYREIGAVRAVLLEICAQLAAWVDFPEEGEQEEVFTAATCQTLRVAYERLLKLENGYTHGALLRDGVPTAIVGKPNVGKSTLMNLLAGEDASIVTDIPGTTRDVVESVVMLRGITLRLWDTAGIRVTQDPVEIAGIKRARSRLEQARLVLVVLEAGEELEEEETALLQSLAGKPAIAVLNKADLCKENATLYAASAYVRESVAVCAKTGAGMKALEEAVLRVLSLDTWDPAEAALVNERQLQCAKEAREALGEALQAVEQGMTLDAVNVCIDDAVEALLTLTGENIGDAVVEAVFANFCVGK